MRRYMNDSVQENNLKVKKMYLHIVEVLNQHIDTNLGSEVGRNTIAQHVCQAVYDITVEEWGHSYADLNKKLTEL